MTMHEHGVSLSHYQLLFLSVCLAEYCQVGEYHDGAWNPKRYRARYYRIHTIHFEFARVRISFYEFLVLFGGVPARKYWDKREQCRRYPCVQDHNCNNFFRNGHGILQWFHDGIVSVQIIQTRNKKHGEEKWNGVHWVYHVSVSAIRI